MTEMELFLKKSRSTAMAIRLAMLKYRNGQTPIDEILTDIESILKVFEYHIDQAAEDHLK